ncbi:tyrosine-type recombinase/integrase [Nocardia farcinica]|uniref:tyrosine-type recombinase/integrase n=1 Tax=Nocardia farcinica TaxID=37329 RepID=UPI002458DE6B|nr:site-specific integrase [Nocardia farcinica]
MNVLMRNGQDLSSIRLPRWGRVAPVEGAPVPWCVIDPDGSPVWPIERFLGDFSIGNSPGSVRSYAYALLRWWRWLQVVDVAWDRATSAEVRDLVLWLQATQKQRRYPRTASVATAGGVNPITRKRNLSDRYEPSTIRHSNAVLASFYGFWIDIGEGPVVNPVPRDRRGGRRPNEHHNPLEPWRAEGRLRYNPKLPKRKPRAIPDTEWNSLFGALQSHRDRAILAVAVSNGARASELLGMRAGVDLDWGEQLVRVVRKGTRVEQWLPSSPEAFVWIRLYLAELRAPLAPDEPLWQTLRRRRAGPALRRIPLTYGALRAVFRRVNALLGTNWTMHDLRHTAALRMAADKSLSLRDIQVILGHTHLSTTADVYLIEDENQVIRRVASYLADRERRVALPPVPVADGYDAADLTVLFGGEAQ